MKIDLTSYLKNRVEKLDTIVTSVSIETRHKEYIEANGINFSALIRDFLDAVILEADKKLSRKKSAAQKRAP